MMFENRHSKKKELFYREAIFHSTFFFYPFLFLPISFWLRNSVRTWNKSFSFIAQLLTPQWPVFKNRTWKSTSFRLIKQNINKYLIIKVNFRFTHVYFMEFLSIFQLKKLWKFITIFGDFWEDTRTVIYIFNKQISHISNLYRHF